MEAVRLRKTPGRNLRAAQITTTAMMAKFSESASRCAPWTLKPILRASHCTGAACLRFAFSSWSSPSASRVSWASSRAMLLWPGAAWLSFLESADLVSADLVSPDLVSADPCCDVDAADCSCAYARAGTDDKNASRASASARSPAPEGAVDRRRLAASLKRCPDTRPLGFFVSHFIGH